MNSEELEQSLRSEFEAHLNSVLADLREETHEFQNKIQAEFDRHRAQFDEAFAEISARLNSTAGLSEAFNSSVAEHLKLARDEGAKLAANAMVEAEKLDDRPAPAARYNTLRDAVRKITKQDSQSAILKSLVQHAAEFAPRGAFFIIKSNHFAGWKIFGTDEAVESTIREVHFPVSQNTILGSAIESLSTVKGESGTYGDDRLFLEPLALGEPDQMMAFPLIARGRGVAVMYVDGGDTDGDINREALETLVAVAGLTVELLASTQTAAEENRTMGAADFENTRPEPEDVRPQYAPYDPTYSSPAAESSEAVQADEPSGFSFTESAPVEYEQPFTEAAPEYGTSFANEPVAEAPEVQNDFGSQFATTVPAIEEFETPAFSQEFEKPTFSQEFEAPAFTQEFEAPAFTQEAETPAFTPASQQTPFAEDIPPAAPLETDYSFGLQEPAVEQPQNIQDYPAASVSDFQSAAPAFSPVPEQNQPSPFGSGGSIESAAVGSSPFDRAVEEYRPSGAATGAGYTPAADPIVPAPTVSAPQGRLSDRPVDLPIDVPEDERRLHNDARRFARLLVSEIKLYNEKKVIEGKQSHDLYERLREAIDRSREMYDKRVQPPVASNFDYFHYELLNSLADGKVERLGAGYPGASV